MANGDNAFFDFLAGGDWGSLTSETLKSSLPFIPQAEYFSAPAAEQFMQTPEGRARGTGAVSPRRRRYFQQAYQDVFGDYLGAMGTSMRAGKEPATFQSFLDTDPWTKRYSQLPQYERGVTKTYTDPRTRFIFY
jgi:hypothetical protein